MNEYVRVVDIGVFQAHDLMSWVVVIKLVSFDVGVADA